MTRRLGISVQMIFAANPPYVRLSEGDIGYCPISKFNSVLATSAGDLSLLTDVKLGCATSGEFADVRMRLLWARESSERSRQTATNRRELAPPANTNGGATLVGCG